MNKNFRKFFEKNAGEVEFLYYEYPPDEIVEFFKNEFHMKENELKLLRNIKIHFVKGLDCVSGAFDKINKVIYLNNDFVCNSEERYFEEVLHELTHAVQYFQNRLISYEEQCWDKNISEMEAVNTTYKYLKEVLDLDCPTWQDKVNCFNNTNV